jgi:DhnA family fructose-bisphosphate aldolase class Ia
MSNAQPQPAREAIVWTRGALSNARKQIIVAIDHGLSFPDMPGLEHPRELLQNLASDPNVSGLIASPGIYRQARRWGIDLMGLNRLITVDYLVQEGAALRAREIYLTPQDAADYQPDCYKMFFNIYKDRGDLMKNIHDFSRFAAEGRRLGISCLAEVLFFNNPEFLDGPKRQAELLQYGCRVAMELGADVLKVPLIEDRERLCEIIDRLAMPPFILGGAKADGDSFIQSMRGLAKLPVSGVMLGRNICRARI